MSNPNPSLASEKSLDALPTSNIATEPESHPPPSHQLGIPPKKKKNSDGTNGDANTELQFRDG